MKKIESGRSMIEMLGVLAIIGVLSIGGLAGYTMAMNRHRANTLINDASLCITKEQTKNETGLISGTVTCTNTTISGATIKVKQGTSGTGTSAVTDETKVDVEFTGVSEAVLKAIASRFGGTVTSGHNKLTITDYTGTPSATSGTVTVTP